MAANSSISTALSWLGRLILGGIFICGGAIKCFDAPTFAADIDQYHLLPYPLTIVAGVYLPWLELVCGTAVIFRWKESGALVLLAGLCGIFCIATASAWLRGFGIDCGCFGHAATTTLPVAFTRSFMLGLIALYLLGRERHNLTSHSQLSAVSP